MQHNTKKYKKTTTLENTGRGTNYLNLMIVLVAEQASWVFMLNVE